MKTGRQGSGAAVILGYHAVSDGAPLRMQSPEQAFYTVEKDSFEAQLDMLQREGCRVCLPEQFLEDDLDHAGKTVLITVDDGYESDVAILLPLLLKRSFRAVFFVCLEFIGKPGYMDWAQIQSLSTAGMSVQSHGLLHHDLTQVSEQDAFHELHAARTCLERNLGKPVRYLALPGGFASPDVFHAAGRAGYEAVFHSKPGLAQAGEMLPRFMIRRGTSRRDFEKLIRRRQSFLLLSSLRVRTSEFIKAAVGVQRYEALKVRFWQ
jgi:peptidoglycan/xylan/chitin deacetylase (PgdA/CDA1 family)